MAVGTNIIWSSEPVMTDNTTLGNENGPLFLACFSAPKGPEDLRIVVDGFDSLYGTNFSFARYGQPLLQARRIISSGGRLLCKRLVPDDATYGNLIFGATVKSVDSEVQKTVDGEKIYLDTTKEPNVEIAEKDIPEDGKPDGVVNTTTYKPVMVQTAEISYYATSMEDVKDTKTVEAEVLKETLEIQNTEGETVTMYPLFAFVDNGRGNSGKSIRIDYKTMASKTNKQAIYTLTDVENSVDIQTVNFTLNPDVVFSNKSYAISKNMHPQFISYFAQDGYTSFISKVSEITGLSTDELKAANLLNGQTYREETIEGITIKDTVDFDFSSGLALQNGKDGIDSDADYKTWFDTASAKFFKPDETVTAKDAEDIYNTDIYKIDAVADANYSLATKANIVELAEFRKDFFYYRDLGLGNDGLGLTTFDQIKEVVLKDEIKASKFAGSYCTSYQVTNPYTQKPIHVTCLYSLVDAIISHFTTGRHLPFAGYKITDYLEGTIDFVPKKTPKVDQKEMLENIKVNCISFTSLTDFMLETMYTSTAVDGQLNYIQNVLAVQHVIKDIRTYCPAYRSTFTGTDDADDYAASISENVLVNHVSNFESLSFVYDTEDEELSNGEFVASLTFSFNRHIQSETFYIYAED